MGGSNKQAKPNMSTTEKLAILIGRVVEKKIRELVPDIIDEALSSYFPDQADNNNRMEQLEEALGVIQKILPSMNGKQRFGGFDGVRNQQSKRVAGGGDAREAIRNKYGRKGVPNKNVVLEQLNRKAAMAAQFNGEEGIDEATMQVNEILADTDDEVYQPTPHMPSGNYNMPSQMPYQGVDDNPYANLNEVNPYLQQAPVEHNPYTQMPIGQGMGGNIDVPYPLPEDEPGKIVTESYVQQAISKVPIAQIGPQDLGMIYNV